MARHRSPRGRHAHPARSLPPVGSTADGGARRGPLPSPVDLRAVGAQVARLAAVRVPARPPGVPDTVLRGVALATVAAVGVTGAGVALAGSTAPAPDAATPQLAAAPSIIAAAGQAALTVPVPELVAPGATAAPPPAVLDPDALSRAVARAQEDARRLAEQERRTHTPAQAGTDGRDDDADEHADEQARAQDTRDRDSDDARAEAERTAERARRAGRAAEPEEKAAPSTSCDLNTSQLGAVKPFVHDAAEFLGCAFGEPTVLGVAGRAGTSDHPKGRALDFMVDRATGDRLAACALRNREALGVSYVIWRQRIDTGDGFRPMEDRGSPTANHFDHVHVSFEPGAGTGEPTTC